MRLSRHAASLATLPLVATALVVYLGSVLWTLMVSLTASRTFPNAHYVGAANYLRLFDNERWMLSLSNLACYGLLFIAASMLVGGLLALLVDRQVRLESAWRSIFLYPYAMSFVATGVVWQWLLTPDAGIDRALRELGIPAPTFEWLVDQDHVLYTIVIATVWQAAGLVMALMLAGLRGVDPDIWKAARLDGIPVWRVYLSVVLPMLRPTLATVFVLLATSVVKLFDAVVAMTQGGPGTASEVPAKFIMDNLFGRANVGLGSAGAIVLLLPVVAVIAPYLYAQRHIQAK
jgi:glucose/mannose transport system permease protein